MAPALAHILRQFHPMFEQQRYFSLLFQFHDVTYIPITITSVTMPMCTTLTLKPVHGFLLTLITRLLSGGAGIGSGRNADYTEVSSGFS